MEPFPQSPRVVIIFNPAAGQADQAQASLEQVSQLWRDRGWQVDLAPTQFAGHATELAQNAAHQGYTCAIAAGGDGTVNEVMNGLVGSRTALGVLPIGTVNIWAREMGLPMETQGAAKGLLDAEIVTVDVGQAGDRYFLLMAGIGFDAAVTAQINPREKKWLGAIAYVKQAFHTAWQFRGVRTALRIDGKRIRGRILMIVVGNSQLYGGVVKMTAHAVINDGLLDVCVIKGRSMLVAPLRLLSIFLRNYNRDPKVKYYKARQISITGKRHLPVQVDGDFLGHTPLQFQIKPKALRVLVPPTADQSLFL